MLGNFKIKVKNEFDAKEVQGLFEKIGYELECFYAENFPRWVVTEYCEFYDYWYTTGFDFYVILPNHKELNLPKLRDMVVLNQNDVGDWNCIDPEFKEQKLYLCSDKTLYVFDEAINIWKVSSKNGVNLVLNRLIMKRDQSLNSLISVTSEGLISSSDAKLAWAKGEDVQISFNKKEWKDIISNDRLLQFEQPCGFYRIKPRTITLNVEIPAPFEPKDGEIFYTLETDRESGYNSYNYIDNTFCKILISNSGAWRTELEIKQVVAALKNGIKGVENV